MIVRRLHFRFAGYALLGWILAESLLFYAAVQSIGALPTIAFLTLKGLGGLALLAVSLRSVFRSMAARTVHRGLSGMANALFSAAGAAMILLPGFAATLAGLALFSPSVRASIIRWLWSEKKRGRGEQIITLDADEWRELGTKAPPRPRRSKSSIAP